jgi:LexA-binding, inner membrane-associated putative hydrolase
VACTAFVLLADLILWLTSPPLGIAAVVDEPAHAATALVVLAGIGFRFDRRFLAGVLAGSILIDLDHIPGLAGSHIIAPVGMRPYSHTLLVPLLVLGAAAAVRGRTRLVLVGAFVGLVCHLARDVAEPQQGAPGAPLLWPLSSQSFVVDYIWYGVAIVALTAAGVMRRTASP